MFPSQMLEEYAPKSSVDKLVRDLDRLAEIVENLSIELKENQRENKENIKNLTIELAKETAKLTCQTERLSITLEKMQEQLSELIRSNMRSSILIEWIKSSPKFVGGVFGGLIFFFIFFTSDAHKDILKYMASLEKAKYSIQQ